MYQGVSHKEICSSVLGLKLGILGITFSECYLHNMLFPLFSNADRNLSS